MRNRWKNFVAWVDASVTLLEDSESIRIRKTTITIAYLVFIPITFLWTLALFNIQLWAAGARSNLQSGRPASDTDTGKPLLERS